MKIITLIFFYVAIAVHSFCVISKDTNTGIALVALWVTGIAASILALLTVIDAASKRSTIE